MRFLSRITPTLALLICSGLQAQETTGTMTGSVQDTKGRPIPNATVVISSPKMLGARTAVTDRLGQYRIPLLPNGDYRIVVNAKDHLTSTGSSKVIPGQTSKADAVLKSLNEVATQEAVVEVVAVASQQDKTTTVTQFAMNATELDKLSPSDPYAALALAPGIASDSWAPKIRGGAQASSRFVLNGVAINDSSWGYDPGDMVMPDLIESSAVITSPLNAKYGNTDGGIVSFVSARGTNEFAGSIRVEGGRAGRGASATPYARRNGAFKEFTPSSDDATKVFDVALRGPIWKDHITFAYGGRFSPRTSTTTQIPKRFGNVSAWDNWGTFFKNPATGGVIRDANLADSGKFYQDWVEDRYNNYTLYWQITTDHQLEWNYVEASHAYNSKWPGFRTWADEPLSFNAMTPSRDSSRVWGLSYKGIIGQSGVLEAHVGRNSRIYGDQDISGWSRGIWPVSPRYGFVGPGADEYVNSYADLYVQANAGIAALTYPTRDQAVPLVQDTASLNYEKILETPSGTHQIDIGFNRDGSKWSPSTVQQDAPHYFYPMGQLTLDPSAKDSTGAAIPASFLGKYIVANWQATLADMGWAGDPTSVYADTTYKGMLPYMYLNQGAEDGTVTNTTDSFYINDLWSLSQRHSLMMGLRYDRTKVGSASQGTVLTYGVFSPRAEYKWDVKGDQSRLLNVSLGRFHARVPTALFRNAMVSRLDYESKLYWTGVNNNPALGGPNVPYLVSYAELTDLNNWKKLDSFTGDGAFLLDSNWKAMSSDEVTVGFRRNYDNGATWRATLVHKVWRNLYDWFPLDGKGTLLSNPYVPGAVNPSFKRILRNDPDAHRAYNSVEFEWSVPLTKKVSFGGNYVFARLMSDAMNAINDSPSGSRDGSAVNWVSYVNQFVPRDQWAPMGLQEPMHSAKAWFVFDLSEGAVKSNLTLRGSYTSGAPWGPTYRVQIPRTIIPGYYDGPNGPNTLMAGTRGNVYPYFAGVNFTGQDRWNSVLTYSLQVPVYRKLTWFIDLSVNNPFNHRGWGDYSAGGTDLGRVLKKIPYGSTTPLPDQTFPWGWRGTGMSATDKAESDTMPDVGVSGNRMDGRSVSFQTGFRF